LISTGSGSEMARALFYLMDQMHYTCQDVQHI
jgi:hypothetical protein